MSHEAADADRPLGGLPPAEPVLLAQSQLEVALVEVRFSGLRDAVTTNEVLGLRQLLADAGLELPRMQATQQQQIAVAVTPGGDVTPELEVRASGWQLASDDGHLVATVLPNMVAVQSTHYERWSTSLSPTLQTLVAAVGATLEPELVHRVGVRYVNRLTLPDAVTPAAWTGSINPKVLGPLTDDVLGATIAGSQQQLELKLGDAHGALVRHGAFADGAIGGRYSYLVDIDVFDQTTARFDVSAIAETSRTLNRTALSLFQLIVTPAYRDSMQPYAALGEAGTVIGTSDDALVTSGEHEGES
jgi:uncharacterized protein (TIGR04255 family)